MERWGGRSRSRARGRASESGRGRGAWRGGPRRERGRRRGPPRRGSTSRLGSSRPTGAGSRAPHSPPCPWESASPWACAPRRPRRRRSGSARSPRSCKTRRRRPRRAGCSRACRMAGGSSATLGWTEASSDGCGELPSCPGCAWECAGAARGPEATRRHGGDAVFKQGRRHFTKLLGLRSRWQMPWWWRYTSASSSRRVTSRALFSG